MAYIKVLKDEDLAKGTSTDDVYPVSTTQALYSQDSAGNVRMTGEGLQRRPEKLEDRLQDHEEDALELHRKAEKLVVRIENNQDDKDLEFKDSTTYTMHLVGSAGLETYGDEPEEVLSPDPSATLHMASYSMTVESSGTEFSPSTTVVGNTVVADFSPLAPGTYTATFSVTNNDGERSVEKSDSSVTYIVLKKYFGFSSDIPNDITTLDGNNFSHSVASTITIPAHSAGEKFKHVYIAVPEYLIGRGKSLSARQPDALNAPFPLRKISENVQRTVNGNSYTYYLFESGTTAVSEDGLVDSTVTKRLTLSVV